MIRAIERALVLALAFQIGFPLSLFAGDPLRALSRKLNNELQEDKDMALGVLNFTYARGRMSTGSYLVSERLLTYLVQEGATVIERRLLDSLLAEQRFSQIGITNIGTLQRMGKVLGVDAVVLGTLDDRPDNTTTDVIARVIRVDTAEVLAAGSAATAHIWLDDPRAKAATWARSPTPDVSLPRTSTPSSRSDNTAIPLEPNEPKRVLGEHFQNLTLQEDGGERLHLTSTEPLSLPRYKSAPVPSFFNPIGKQVRKGGGSK
jgi:hypothetical protein